MNGTPLNAFATITSCINLVRQVIQIAEQTKNAELRLACADLALKLADLKGQLAKAQEEILRLRSQIDELTKQHDVRKKLVLRQGSYYLTEAIQGFPEGPFCTACMDVRGKLVVKILPDGPDRVFGLTCPECELKSS
jgi:hypothetical protein